MSYSIMLNSSNTLLLTGFEPRILFEQFLNTSPTSLDILCADLMASNEDDDLSFFDYYGLNITDIDVKKTIYLVSDYKDHSELVFIDFEKSFLNEVNHALSIEYGIMPNGNNVVVMLPSWL